MKLRLRMKILNLSIVAMVLFSFVFVLIVGGKYTINMKDDVMAWEAKAGESILSAEIVTESDNIEIKNDVLKDGNFTAEIYGKSGGVGKTKISLELDTGEKRTYYYNFYVMPFGTVFRTDNFNFNGYKLIIVLAVLQMFIIEAVMIISFTDLLNKAQYSYSMIAYGGTAIFFASLLVLIMGETFFFGVPTFGNFLMDFIYAAVPFLILTAPLVVLLAIAVSISNIVLMKKEGFHPYNALGIIVGVLWVGSIIYLIVFRNFSGSEFEVAIKSAIHTVVLVISSYFECMIISTMVCAYAARCHKPNFDRDYIIILGCAIRSDGTLTPLLRDRTESALKFEREQFARTGWHARFVPSGGQGSDEVISESEAMKRYLIEQGVPEEQIIKEDKSVNTFQNLKFSKERIEESAGDKKYKAAFATTGYHIFRGYILAKKNDFRAEGIASKTKWYFFPNAFLREFVGLLVDKKFTHIVSILLIIAFYFGISYILEFISFSL